MSYRGRAPVLIDVPEALLREQLPYEVYRKASQTKVHICRQLNFSDSEIREKKRKQ